jgi:stage V sporulation protein D (sporulation-specific penicillin-binding protein)
VVEQLLNPDGSVAYDRQPTVVRQVISEQTSKTVRSILEKVVGDPKDGTGRNAAVAGYRIGGKTGTREKVSLEAQTGEKEYIVSFIGFAPADDPQIAILVFLDTPSNRSGVYISGGQMAAPVVGNMMSDILPYLGVEAKEDQAVGIRADIQMPVVEGLSLQEAGKQLEAVGLRWRTIGDGEIVTDQLPSAGISLAVGTEIIVYLGAEPSKDLETVPDLNGMTYEQARDTLSYYGLYLQTNSPLFHDASQYIGSQNVAPGSFRRHGDVIQVTLISGDDSLLGKY